MSQIHGSGAGNFANTAVVDSSLGVMQGRLYTNSVITQQVEDSPENSSTTNLLAGGSFVGSAISTLGVNAIQVSLSTDRNCTIYVDQSPNGSNWDISDNYKYYTGKNNFGLTIQAINSYVRTRVINNDTTGSTTHFRLQTVLCPIVEAVPRSLDEDGNLQVGIKSTKDGYGFSTENTPMGELRAIAPYRMIGTQFAGNVIDNNFWTSGVVSGGLVSIGGGRVALEVGSVNAEARLDSVRVARYVAGASNRFRTVARFGTSGVENNIRRLGAYNNQDGCFFELAGSQFNLVTRKATVDTKVVNGSFNGVLGNNYNLDTNAKTWEIYWTNSKVYYVIGDDLIHTSTFNTDTWSSTPNLPIRFENFNVSGGSSYALLNTRVASIYKLGTEQTQPNSKYQTGQISGIVLKYGPGNLHGIAISNVSNTAYINLTDNITSGGQILYATGAMGAQATPFAIDLHNMPFFSGLTMTIGGATCNATIIYE